MAQLKLGLLTSIIAPEVSSQCPVPSTQNLAFAKYPGFPELKATGKQTKK